MERKIGEIFEFKKDWYQCVEGRCKDCHFSEKRFLCKQFITKDFCTHGIIFKKLEKVGEPYIRWLSPFNNIMVQRYRLYGRNVIMPNEPYIYFDAIDGAIEIELKQEYMEEKELNLKPFDIQKAREGKPVCTRDGRKARIICFDSTLENYPLVVLVGDYPYSYTAEGKFNKDSESSSDLMMLPEKKEGWVNVYYDIIDGITFSKHPYPSKEEAIKNAGTMSNRVDSVKIFWEE